MPSTRSARIESTPSGVQYAVDIRKGDGYVHPLGSNKGADDHLAPRSSSGWEEETFAVPDVARDD